MRAHDKRFRRLLATLFLAGLALTLGIYAWGAFVIVRVPTLVEFNPDGTVRQVHYKLIPWTWVWDAGTLPKEVPAETELPDGTRVAGAATYNSGHSPIIVRPTRVHLERRWGSRYKCIEVLTYTSHESFLGHGMYHARWMSVRVAYE